MFSMRYSNKLPNVPNEVETFWYAVFRFFRRYATYAKGRYAVRIHLFISYVSNFTLESCNFHQETQQT